MYVLCWSDGKLHYQDLDYPSVDPVITNMLGKSLSLSTAYGGNVSFFGIKSKLYVH